MGTTRAHTIGLVRFKGVWISPWRGGSNAPRLAGIGPAPAENSQPARGALAAYVEGDFEVTRSEAEWRAMINTKNPIGDVRHVGYGAVAEGTILGVWLCGEDFSLCSEAGQITSLANVATMIT